MNENSLMWMRGKGNTYSLLVRVQTGAAAMKTSMEQHQSTIMDIPSHITFGYITKGLSISVILPVEMGQNKQSKITKSEGLT